MKRLIVIFCCLAVIFAGLASAWADCRKVSFVADDHNSSARRLPEHENHSDSQHEHSRGTVIHCPTLDEFFVTSTFSLRKDHRFQRITDPFGAAVDYQFSQPISHWSIHGPPGLPRLNSIPPYLLLSVFRI